jgi:hypothetical protein
MGIEKSVIEVKKRFEPLLSVDYKLLVRFYVCGKEYAGNREPEKKRFDEFRCFRLAPNIVALKWGNNDIPSP